MGVEADTRQGAHQSWIVLVILFSLANFLEVAVMAHLVLFTPAFLGSIGFSETDIASWTGPLASAGFLFGIWFVPLWGVFADRYGRKPLIMRSYYVEVVAMALAAVSQNVWLYLVARSLTGLALGNTGLMYAALTETAPINRLALALSLVNGSAPLGSLMGGVFGGVIVAAYGVHVLFWIDAGVAVVIALLLLSFYHETFVPRPTPGIGHMLRDALRAIVDSPVAMTIFIVSFVYNAAFFFSFAYLPVRIGEIVGKEGAALAVGNTQGLAGAATLIGSAVWGGVADRVGHRRLVVLLMAAAMVLWLPIYASQDLGELTVSWAMFSLVNPAVSSVMFAIISLNVPAGKRGSVLSMIYLPMNLAFIVGPVSAAVVATHWQVRDVFLVSAVLSLMALVVFVTNLRHTRSEQTRA